MHYLDWIILFGTQLFIIAYGIWKSRGSKDLKGYLLGNKDAHWFTIGLSIMATQASAITFLSAPGQAYTDGMRFIHIYLGMPIAMVILAVTVVPIYHKLNVYTAYEFLESRFNLPTRMLTALLFLTQRGLAAGFTIFAPSLILSSLLGWDIHLTTLAVGLTVIIYTVIGGTKAVSQTQKQQMAIILVGMFIAGVMVITKLPDAVSFGDAMQVAGKMGKLNAIDFTFDLSSKYNIWSGMIGGLFLMLSYFGTDQSQVQRYLSGKSIAQSRLGLIFNGIVKIPMQFAILFLGAMLYVFYIFNAPPVFFNKVLVDEVKTSKYAEQFDNLETKYEESLSEKREIALNLVEIIHTGDENKIRQASEQLERAEITNKNIRQEAVAVIKQNNKQADTNDTNYIFIRFVLDFLPIGVIGLIISVILSASMSSTSSELNALASTTIIDIYKRSINPNASDKHYLFASKVATFSWGIYAIIFAMFANRLGTLIEAVNILGSLVYGTILGIFLVAFFFKKVGAKATFIAAIVSELTIIACFMLTDIPYLWFNVIGSLVVVLFGIIFQIAFFGKEKKNDTD